MVDYQIQYDGSSDMVDYQIFWIIRRCGGLKERRGLIEKFINVSTNCICSALKQEF